ncbi:MAG: S8 family serine peptidase [Nitrospinae bacterium]|nr:S8 family serine peptidase [Nitrospinota bacterium]
MDISSGDFLRGARSSRALAVLLLAVAVFVTACGGADISSTEGLPEKDPSARELTHRAILAKAGSTGSAQVIIKLKTPFVAEGVEDAATSAAQQAGIATAQDEVEAHVAGRNVKNIKKYKHIPFIAMEADSPALNAIINHPKVEYVDSDNPVSTTLAQSVPLIGGDIAWNAGYTGAGYAVAVLDTGVTSGHAFLSGKVVAEACYLTGNKCPNGQSSMTGAGAAADVHGHGTHVSGIAAGASATMNGVAKDASIIGVKILDDTGSGWDSDILLGLDWVFSQRNNYSIAAVNMSLGDGSAYSSYCDSNHAAYKAAMDNLSSVNIATVVASGNSGSKSGISSPACVSTAVSVGATTKTDSVASYSQSASILSVLAPGSSIYSSIPSGYQYKSGTSMATPHVAGAWAVMKSQYGAGTSVSAILATLQANGASITDTNGLAKKRISLVVGGPSPAPATMSTPAPGSTLAGSSVTFTWTQSTTATAYVVWVGTVRGAYDIGYFPSAGQTTALSADATGLPTDGRTLYVRLYSKISGAWQYNDYTYTAGSPGPVAAVMSSPTPNSTLTGADITFSWNAAVDATGYRVDVGTTVGGAEIGTFPPAGETAQTSVQVTGLPVDGSTLYVRLLTKIGGQWYSNDYTYTAFNPNAPQPGPAVMTSPAPGSTLAGSSVTFQWTQSSTATAYVVWIGTVPGAYNIGYYPASGQTSGTSVVANGLPTDGRTLYVRLYSKISGAWQYYDYTYTAGSPGPVAAVISSPAPGSTLTGADLTFSWNAAVGATGYRVDVGTTVGGAEIGTFPPAGETAQTSVQATGLPVDGSALNVRLLTKIGGQWYSNDYTYTAFNPNAPQPGPAVMTSPAPGSTLAGSSITFQWTQSSTATAYVVWIGTVPGAYNIGYYPASGQTTGTSTVASGLPTDGRTLYVRLYSKISGAWQYYDYTYTAGSPGPVAAVMSSPAPGSTLTGADVTFSWNAASGATGYRVDVGTTVGGAEIGTFPPAGETAQTSVQATGLPVDGSTLYVRLLTKIGGQWYSNDYTYTAFNPNAPQPGPAVMTSPAPGSTLAGSSITFTWTQSSNATAYALWVGTVRGAYDIGYFPAAGQTTATSVQATGLPTNGRTLYVRLYSKISGAWQYNDYTYVSGP